MIDLSQITTTWTAFAKANNVDLIHKQRVVNDITQTQFAVNYTTTTEFYSFVAFAQQSLEKESGTTTIIIELKDKLNIDNFVLEANKEIPSRFETKILEGLKIFNGKTISLNNHFIIIDCHHIFDSQKEFDAVKDLLLVLKPL